MSDEPYFSRRGDSPLEVWLHPARSELFLASAVVAALLVGYGVLVYETGGVPNVFVHFAYFPITLAALLLGLPGALISALAAGVLVLPQLMPVADPLLGGGNEPLREWGIRQGFFLLGALTAGLGSNLLRRTLQESRRKAYFDGLTGLPNATHFRTSLDELLAEERAPLSTAYIARLNSFNTVSAIFGPAVVEPFLQSTARRLSVLRDGQLQVFRIHGGDFALLVAKSPEDGLARRIHEILRQPVAVAGITVMTEPTVGYATVTETDTDPAGTALRRATTAAFRAFRNRQPLAGYDEDRDALYHQRLSLLGDLRRALGTNQLSLAYQPKMALSDGRLLGCEALLRWRHPQKGTVSPGHFIPLAEETGLMWPLTLAVLEMALEQMRAWSTAGHRLPVAVNFSAKDFGQGDMAARVLEQLHVAGLDYELLELEVTESALMNEGPEARRNLDQLHEAGVQIAVDDYGTGVSSISYLREIPAHALKIDQSFVRGAVTSPKDRAIVRSTVDLGHDLGFSIVAEGLEDQATVDLMRGLGCDVGQGYFLGRPVPAEEFTERFLLPTCNVIVKN